MDLLRPGTPMRKTIGSSRFTRQLAREAGESIPSAGTGRNTRWNTKLKLKGTNLELRCRWDAEREAAVAS